MINYLITVVGATAIGKTSLSIALAQHFNTSIISCDSRQFYKEMNIGTAVPSVEEQAIVQHYFIQNRSIFDNYSVGQFEKDAIAKLQEVFQKNNVVIMVGGSGLYANAVLEGLDHFPKVSPEIRLELNEIIEKGEIKTLQNQLKALDVISFESIEIDNPHRLTRALEICIGTGKPYSSFKNKNKLKRDFISIKIGLNADRKIMYDRINKRVDLMIQNGLIEEAQKLYPHKNLNALQTVGYKELFSHFDGECSLEFAIEEIKKNTRRFAKRQVTWNKKDTDIHWFDFKESPFKIIQKITELIST
jgi:tRNA dimethylallyltransferase